ncbi:cobalamin biosynthesis protein CobG [Streptomyces sp. NBC_00370]|uniref:cobalamin biosynthesis protein CobG n=1 Tax=Streptomyces sp. NBC_00370 TaxID=2975728 RepID=UPI003FA72C39
MPPTSPTPVNRDEAPARERGPAVRERGDACPGALRLHPADDGRLARLRLPAGLLTFRQAEVLASAAERLGDGHLDLTSRGNVQLRGLGESCGGELARLLYDAGLLPSEEHERVRNIVASPLAGLDEVPYTDVQLWARELDGLLCASPAATGLSGRFLFALDDGRGDVAELGADVTLLARPDGSATVRTGTNRTGGPVVLAANAPKAALVAAETFLTLAEATGSGAWRVRELPDGHGLAGAVEGALRAAGLLATGGATAEPGDTAGPGAAADRDTVQAPDTTTERAIQAGRNQSAGPETLANPDATAEPGNAGPEATAAPCSTLAPGPEFTAGPDPTPGPEFTAGPDPTPGPEFTAGPDPEATPLPEATAGPGSTPGPDSTAIPPSPDAGTARPHVPGAQPPPGLIHSPRDGTTAVSVYAPLGRLSVAQWRLLQDTRSGTGELRVTPWRGVVIPGLAPAAARDLLARLRTAGLITDVTSPWYGVSACTGRPGCAKALSDVRSDAAPRRHPDDPPVHWSGCARRCGHPAGRSWVDLVATGEGIYQPWRQTR